MSPQGSRGAELPARFLNTCFCYGNSLTAPDVFIFIEPKTSGTVGTVLYVENTHYRLAANLPDAPNSPNPD